MKEESNCTWDQRHQVHLNSPLFSNIQIWLICFTIFICTLIIQLAD